MKLPLVLATVAAAAVTGAVAAPSHATQDAILKASPKQVNFGTRAVGSFTVKGTTITNTSSTDLLVSTSAVRMPDQFSWGLLEGQTCPVLAAGLLRAGESCDLVAGFFGQEFFAGLEDLAVLRLTAADPTTGAIVDEIDVEFRGVSRT